MSDLEYIAALEELLKDYGAVEANIGDHSSDLFVGACGCCGYKLVKFPGKATIRELVEQWKTSNTPAAE